MPFCWLRVELFEIGVFPPSSRASMEISGLFGVIGRFFQMGNETLEL
ncbi:MAG: hypothetical protein EZS28_052943, partial [Streblomastix strix]